MKPVRLASRDIGPGSPCFVIAEAGVNHNGDEEMALRLVDAAVEAKADAVKFQTFTAEALVTADAPKAGYQKETTGEAESQFAMIKALELSGDAYARLKTYCDDHGIMFLSSPFDETSADLLFELDVEAFKIPSGEITNLPYLEHIAGKSKPMIVSSGMADLGEVETAVRTIAAAGNRDVVLLHCVSNYPTEPSDVNLKAMATMSAAFGLPVGYSDHTVGIEVPIAAVAMGAHAIEKHFTLDRNLPGPDHRASLEPDQLAAMVRGIRIAEVAMGHGRKEPIATEADTAAVARKSLVAATDIAAGTALTRDLIALKRPGTGLPAQMMPHVLGRVVRDDTPVGALLTLEGLE